MEDQWLGPYSALFTQRLDFMRGRSNNGWVYKIPKEQGKKKQKTQNEFHCNYINFNAFFKNIESVR